MRANAYQLVDIALHTKITNLTIEFRRGHSTLEDIAEYQRSTTLVVDATTHKVEGNTQRVDIRIIRVVDQCTASLTFLHLKAHGNRFERGHPLS